jgi:hypothetical protein
VISGNAYLLQTLQGKDLSKTLNKCFLKQYHPSMWQDAKVNRCDHIELVLGLCQCFWFAQLRQKAGGHMLSTTLTELTVRAHAELVMIPSFLRDLLAKSARLTRESVCNGSTDLSLYIYEGLRPIGKPTIDQSINIHLVLYILP